MSDDFKFDEEKKPVASSSWIHRPIGGLVFVGCLFVGIGLGLLFWQPGVGALIGMGVGFIALAFLK